MTLKHPKTVLFIGVDIAVMAGCHGPANTEINRPSGDTNNERQLVLKTTTLEDGSFAYAAYYDGITAGFGPGVLIKCDSFTIVDTRNGIFEPDTHRFIEGSFTSFYQWSYSGPDTNFEINMPNHSGLTISQPDEDDDITVPDSANMMDSSSLSILYEPAGPCSIAQVLLDDADSTIQPVVQFDSATGLIKPILLRPLNIFRGGGGIILRILNDSTFSSTAIHSIMVVDTSVTSIPVTWD